MRSRPIFRMAAGVAAAAAVLVAFVPGAAGFTSWTVVASPNPNFYGNIFKAVSARTASDVWAVGNGASTTNNATLAARWTGTAWNTVPTPNLSASCQDGNIQWAGNTLNGVVSLSANNAWAVGHGCYSRKTLIERWNGTAWSIVPSPSFKTGGEDIVNELNGVAAVSASNIWAVGTHTAAGGAYVTLVEHWDGTKWSTVSSPNGSPTSNDLLGVSATGPSDVWAVGYAGNSAPLIEHWNGQAWSVVPTPALPNGSILTAVKAISPTDAWAVGSTTAASGGTVTLVLHWNGQAWSMVPTPNVSSEYSATNVLQSVAAVSATDVWAVGMFENESTDYHQHRTLTLHWDGASWSIVSSPTPGASGELTGVSALATGEVWTAGLYSDYDINIYDGTYTLPQTLVLRG